MAYNQFRWSYTRWSTFDQCKHKYNEQYIKKNPLLQFVESPASIRGNKIHLLAEQFVKGEIKGMPDELEKFAFELRAVKALGAIPEQTWIIDKDWNLVPWDDIPKSQRDWDAYWCQSKTDLHYPDEETEILTVVDYKTGRMYDSHKGQGHMYAVKGMHFYPWVKQVDVEFWYLDSGDVMHFSYKKKEQEAMTKLWSRRARKMEVQQVFPPTKNDGCRWCELKNAGQCSAWD